MNLTDLENGSVICEDDPGEPSTGARRVSVTAKEGAFLRELARGKSVLELGTGLGVSTEYMASTALEVTTVDPDPWVKQNVWPGLPQNVIAMSERPMSAWMYLGLVFIDAEHTVEALNYDLDYAKSLCKQGAIVVHDWITVPELRECLDESWAFVATTHGLAVKFVGWDDRSVH